MTEYIYADYQTCFSSTMKQMIFTNTCKKTNIYSPS